jgi:hypothetical protein
VDDVFMLVSKIDALPHELIEIVGSYDWASLVNAAQTCKSWYEWIRRLQWELVMPIHTSWTDRNYDMMSMVCMLNSMPERLKNDPNNMDCCINGIVSIYVGSQIKPPEYGWQTKDADDAKLREFIKTTWKFDPNVNMKYPERRMILFPKTARWYFLKGRLMKTGGTITDFIGDFAHDYMILPYTGVCDWRREHDASCESNLIWLLTRDMLYCLNITERREISAERLEYDGYKFFGFWDGKIVVMSLMWRKDAVCDVAIHCDDGWIVLDRNQLMYDAVDKLGCRSYYLMYNNKRLNMNRLEIQECLLNEITSAADVKIASIKGTASSEYCYEILFDKTGDPEPPNLFQTTGYNADFWRKFTDSDIYHVSNRNVGFRNKFDNRGVYTCNQIRVDMDRLGFEREFDERPIDLEKIDIKAETRPSYVLRRDQWDRFKESWAGDATHEPEYEFTEYDGSEYDFMEAVADELYKVD